MPQQPETDMTITTTLNRIRAHSPCRDGWGKLLLGLGKTAADDEPLPFARIVEINGLEEALWCCRAEPPHDKAWRLYAVWCARQVQHKMTDPRSIAALDVAERHAEGTATDDELAAAESAAWSAAWIAANSAAGSAARSAAESAAWSAARSAAESAAWSAARSAAWSAARSAARSAAWSAAESAAGAAQTKRFLEVVS
jgi:hypothetical protein